MRLRGSSRFVSNPLDDGEQLGVAHAETGRQRHALVVVVVADALVHELVGHGGGQLVPVLPGDDVEHQVDRRRAAGAGEAVSVDLEQLVGHLDVREILHEPGQILPVDGAAVAVKQPGAGQDMAAGA